MLVVTQRLMAPLFQAAARQAPRVAPAGTLPHLAGMNPSEGSRVFDGEETAHDASRQ